MATANSISNHVPDSAAKATAFADRLRDLLTLNGVTEPTDQAARVAHLAEVSRSTARRWLTGKCRPRAWVDVHHLCEELGANIDWLWFGRGMEPGLWRGFRKVLDAYLNMNDSQRRKFDRLMLRVLNKDPKVYRLHKLAEEGKISYHQLLAAM